MTPSEIQAARLDAARKMWCVCMDTSEGAVISDASLAEIIGEWEVAAEGTPDHAPTLDGGIEAEVVSRNDGLDALPHAVPPASPMTPREALYDALDAAYLEGWNRAKANNHSAHDLMDIVPEEARWLCDADWRLWQEEARRYAKNADYWRKRCEEAYADAARIARESAEALAVMGNEATEAGGDGAPYYTARCYMIAHAMHIEARAREVAEGKGE